MNGWVSDIVCTVNRSSGSNKLYLFTALVKHSQSLLLPSLKVWISVKQSGEVLCAHCTCMAGAGEACSHIVSILFTLDMNTQMKQQFSCTSLPCSSTFRSSPFSEIAKINFQLQSINANKLQDMENHLLKTKNFCPQVY